MSSPSSVRGAQKPKNTGMGIEACSDSAGAGDGRTPRHNREAPVAPYREWAGNILEHSLCFVGRSIWSCQEPSEKSLATEPGWESWDCPAWKSEDPGKILGASSSAQRGSEGWERLGIKTWNGRKRRNGFKVEKRRFRWEIGKKFLQGNAGASQHVPSQPWHREHPEMLQNMEYPI